MTKIVALIKNQYLILLIIVLLAFAARLYKIDNPIADWHSWRQADTASVTRIYLDQGIDLLYPRYYDISFLQTGKPNPNGWRFVEFPVDNALHTLLVSTVGIFSIEKWGRLLSVIFSLVSTVLVFSLSKRFLGVKGGILSAMIFAFMPFNIYFSRVILPEPAAVMFGLAALYFFVRWFDNSKPKALLLSGVFFALALLVKPYVAFYGIPMLWLAADKHKWDFAKLVKDKNLWLFVSVALLPLFAWRVWISQYPEGVPFYKWVFNSDGIRFKPSYWHWIFGQRLGILMLGGWGIVAFAAGILSKSKENEHRFPLMFILGALSYVSIIATANVRHDYYQTLVIPAVAIVVARGILYLWETKDFIQPFTKIFVIVTIIAGLYFSWLPVKEFYKINHPEIIRAGEALDKIAPKNAFVLASYNGDTAFLYQTKRSGWPYQTNSIEELIAKGADYYVSVNLGDPQVQDAMRKFEIPVQTDEYVIVDLNRKRMPKN